MKFIITDWMNNICFDSDNKGLTDFEDASEYLDYCLRAEYGEDCDTEDLREDYWIQEYCDKTDRIMYVGNRFVLKKDYYKNGE